MSYYVASFRLEGGKGRVLPPATSYLLLSADTGVINNYQEDQFSISIGDSASFNRWPMGICIRTAKTGAESPRCFILSKTNIVVEIAYTTDDSEIDDRRDIATRVAPRMPTMGAKCIFQSGTAPLNPGAAVTPFTIPLTDPTPLFYVMASGYIKCGTAGFITIDIRQNLFNLASFFIYLDAGGQIAVSELTGGMALPWIGLNNNPVNANLRLTADATFAGRYNGMLQVVVP